MAFFYAHIVWGIGDSEMRRSSLVARNNRQANIFRQPGQRRAVSASGSRVSGS